MHKELKKLSVIVLVKNSQEQIKRCIDSLLKQSYSNLEIIVVNDSLTQEYEEILTEYKNIKYIKNSKKEGALVSKSIGCKEATGEYIAFLNANDYVSVDFYRTLIENCKEKNSDIAIGNIVTINADGIRKVYNLFDSAITADMKNEECITKLFEQEGLCYLWYIDINKIYSKNIIDKAIDSMKKIDIKNIDNDESIVLSTILYYYAKKVTRVDNDAVFYYENIVDDLIKNINDITFSFKVIEEFLKEKKLFEKLSKNINNWKNLYYIKWEKKIAESEQEKESLKKLIDNFYHGKKNRIIDYNYFYSIQSNWNEGLEYIKERICDPNVKYVSFDIFDTLVVRPFITPTDLFNLLDNYFRQITGIKTGVEFSKIRVHSEEIARKKKWEQTPSKPEITLEDIYSVIEQKYKIDKDSLQKVKEKEIEYEIRFTSKRKTSYNLYKLALAMNKQVIYVSDMYLSSQSIKEILSKSGYSIENKLYLSSETGITKSSGELFKYVIKELNVAENEMIHIGDNYNSDVEKAFENGIEGMFLPKGTNIYWSLEKTNNLSKIFYKSLPGYLDNTNAINFIGIRCMIALMINKYFDNPFRTFNEKSDFNADPILIGYHVLGMHLFAVAKWLMEDTVEKGYDSVVFMARDGYHPMKAYEILKKVYKDSPRVEYLPVSRKSLFPVSLSNKIDFYKLPEVINIAKHSPKEILAYIYDIIDNDKAKLDKIIAENSIDMYKKFQDVSEFNEFISIVIEKLYNKKKHDKKLLALKEYFSNIYSGKSCTFDVGYSARPELYISTLCDKKIDTYFENIATDIAYQHAQIGGFKLNTFYDYKPSVTGSLRESIISELAPSCIGYDCSGEKVKPIYEKYNISYLEKFVLSTLQKYALEFVEDMVNIFGEELKILYYQKSYAILPLEVFIQSANSVDMSILKCIVFEDSVRDGKARSLIDIMNKERKSHNQQNIDKLFNISEYEKVEIPKEVVKKISLREKIKRLFKG